MVGYQQLLNSINIGVLRIQISTDRTSRTRTRATQMLTYKCVEICSTPLTTVARPASMEIPPLPPTPPPPAPITNILCVSHEHQRQQRLCSVIYIMHFTKITVTRIPYLGSKIF